MEPRSRIAALLGDLEAEMRSLLLWEREAPDATALASTQPFCVDTLRFPQWLQFVFLPRMRALLDDGRALPVQCGVAEMAEMHFGGGGAAGLLALLREIDRAVVAAARPNGGGCQK
jgi:uncharacterized protein YqcC (DUF446 family)